MVRTYTGERERVNFYFDKELFEGMKVLARLKNTTYSELIRQACAEFIARHTAQASSEKTQLKDLIR
jgi:predicted transcriptional regulator